MKALTSHQITTKGFILASWIGAFFDFQKLVIFPSWAGILTCGIFLVSHIPHHFSLISWLYAVLISCNRFQYDVDTDFFCWSLPSLNHLTKGRFWSKQPLSGSLYNVLIAFLIRTETGLIRFWNEHSRTQEQMEEGKVESEETLMLLWLNECWCLYLEMQSLSNKIQKQHHQKE